MFVKCLAHCCYFDLFYSVGFGGRDYSFRLGSLTFAVLQKLPIHSTRT